ncbi:MAG TPA: bifunctional [glutamine synthetase] adenylyltransferase/[glutamine synthetase]-adenylyl-L-tyrosine phosphorylase [Rhizomicrobium sp.]|jgi:glutamate-ammonia-ligase adenylyltransferase|nr:bifunctional [glutamine synthetase] adenylyltransferase/[glutamine synthetase]-adenylyl-L-tyrosine phosphorylase [Rhizomicrobium sp.]
MSADAFADCFPALPRVSDAARVERTFEALGDAAAGIPRGAREAFAGAFGNSPYLCRLALRERNYLHAISEQGPAEVFDGAVCDAERVHEAADTPEAMAILRSAKRRAALAIALADIAGLWDVDAVTRALTRFADASVGGALRFLLREAGRAAGMAEDDPAALEASTGLVILAMGKAGAFELNYSSDLDLVAFYDAERFSFRKKSDARGAAVDLIRGLVKLLGETTADGYVFRVDLRLRPDAGATQIAISTAAAERYYEEMGQNWERAAFIKARPCAGDRAAADTFLKSLEPFIWRRSLDYAAIADIHSIKRQIHAHGGHGPIAAAGHNIKLGRGGIREIEFFVQTQQLILGGRNPFLRPRRTLDALEALHARGLVSDSAAAELAACYRYLRRLEHRLQMVEDEQTHTLPRSESGLAHTACFMGCPDTRSFSEELVAKLRLVQRHYESLFEQAPALGTARGSLVFTGVEDDPETLDTLAQMGFRDAGHVAQAIRGWHHGRIRATRSPRARELLTQLMPALLEALAATADPDTAFAQFDRFVSRVPAGIQLFSLFLANPQLLQLVAAITGSAPRLAGDLARSPALLDAVLDRGFLNELPPREALVQLIDGQLAGATDYESALDAVRRFAKEQMFRVGAQLICGSVTTRDGGMAFTNIAECVIAALLQRVEREMAGSAGRVEGGSFCVVAMGRLGGCEMTSASDLDLIFIYDAPEQTERSNGARPLPLMTYYARLAQRLIAALTVLTAEGGLYDVDMRLRPTGNKGPAAVSLASFSRYHARDAWTWERLALTRARVVAGPAALQEKIERVMRESLTRETEPTRLAREVREMRGRLAAEFPERGQWDLKFARGGLVDIEFVAQFLQLRSGRDSAEVLHPNTVAAFERLSARDFLSEQDANALIVAARFQLALLQILRISFDGAFDPEQATAGMKALLMRAAGADEFHALESRLAAAQAEARGVFDRLLPA